METIRRTRINEIDFADDVNAIMNELAQLLVDKHHDYGPKNISLSPGGPINGLRVRMHDKMARINNLIDSGSDAKYESLEDSFKDLANYAVIGLMVLRGKWDTKKNDTLLTEAMKIWGKQI